MKCHIAHMSVSESAKQSQQSCLFLFDELNDIPLRTCTTENPAYSFEDSSKTAPIPASDKQKVQFVRNDNNRLAKIYL